MKLILALILSLPAYLSYAQENAVLPLKQNSVSVTIGHNQFKDENLHPKVFRGMIIGSSFLHTRITKNISEYSAGFKISLLNNTYEDFPSAANILILGNYRYLFSLVRTEKLEYFLGPVADLQWGTSLYFNWDESHMYYANYLSGGVGNRIRYKTGDKTINFNLDIPIISCISRPVNNRQYKIDDMTFVGIVKNLSSNPEVVLPDKNLYVNAGLEMNYLNKRKRIRSVGYNFRYHFMQASNGNPYHNIENAISYKFIFNHE
ncbi:MAG TPA: hypothetical protein VLR52_05965 [Bacteroidales bacterium]|nr:hypothetical protein [Bacteroidales bacterium]